MTRRTIENWVESADCEAVGESANGFGRGDGHDVDAFRSRRTGRYLVRVVEISRNRHTWYVATDQNDAHAVGAPGWTPGCAPGRYRYVSRTGMLREVRAAMMDGIPAPKTRQE